jgi:CBS domain-containing protein
MRVKDLMRRDVQTIGQEESVITLMDILVGQHIHGVPVVDDSGSLVGVVTQQDLVFGTMTKEGADGPTQHSDVAQEARRLTVREIMTSPAFSADEETDIRSLCRMMFKLRIHRVPITEEGKLTGIVSSLDICGAVARGEDIA